MKFSPGDKIIRNKEIAGPLTIWNFSFSKKFQIKGISTNVDDVVPSNYIVILDGKREYVSTYQVDRFYDLDIKETRKDKLLKINKI